MKLHQLPLPQIAELATTAGLQFRCGIFKVRLSSDISSFLQLFSRAYQHTDVWLDPQICHFDITLMRSSGLRRWTRRQALFAADGAQPFDPYPVDQAFPLFEWGLNWCIAMSSHQHLMLHSAAVEKDGHCLILPAEPGSGKTTLCAGLVSRGWRLLSDEFCILRHSDGLALPLPRTAPLKNDSIGLISEFAPTMEIGPRFEGTRKGTVAHLFPPKDSLLRQQQPAKPRWVVFPRYENNSATTLRPYPVSMAFPKLAHNAFNYLVTMEQGFRTITRLLRESQCFELHNGSLEEAIACIEDMRSNG